MNLKLTSVIAAVLVLAVASPAAAVTAEQKFAALSDFTQSGVDSYHEWNSARINQDLWSDYQFDWSTDYCSGSPDAPLGFDFRLSCWRHDFGYRNYKWMGQFEAHKKRVDEAFYADLKRTCATYRRVARPACYSLAWTYYTAVHTFGALAVTDADVQQASQLITAQ